MTPPAATLRGPPLGPLHPRRSRSRSSGGRWRRRAAGAGAARPGSAELLPGWRRRWAPAAGCLTPVLRRCFPGGSRGDERKGLGEGRVIAASRWGTLPLAVRGAGWRELAGRRRAVPVVRGEKVSGQQNGEPPAWTRRAHEFCGCRGLEGTTVEPDLLPVQREERAAVLAHSLSTRETRSTFIQRDTGVLCSALISSHSHSVSTGRH